MKKMITLVLALACVLGPVGCGQQEDCNRATIICNISLRQRLLKTTRNICC